jgi:predicted GIY-YIG superfamily endonuclease
MGSVEDRLAALTTMSSAQLAQEWRTLTGDVIPKVSPALLRLAIAYEIQAKAYGGLSRATEQRLEQHRRGKTQTRPAQPGMRLVREWNGRTHVVMIGEDKVIRWNEREWRSLSEVARAITGTRWSGPAFFGLKRKAAA